jgi:hypothetical protein
MDAGDIWLTTRRSPVAKRIKAMNTYDHPTSYRVTRSLFLIMVFVCMLGIHLGAPLDVSAQTDYGDAPDLGAGIGPGDYETFAASGGASHTLNAMSPFLGNCVDADSGVIANGAATADDLSIGFSTFGTCSTPGDDEDSLVVGARPSPDVVSTGLQIIMTASSPA